MRHRLSANTSSVITSPYLCSKDYWKKRRLNSQERNSNYVNVKTCPKSKTTEAWIWWACGRASKTRRRAGETGVVTPGGDVTRSPQESLDWQVWPSILFNVVKSAPTVYATWYPLNIGRPSCREFHSDTELNDKNQFLRYFSFALRSSLSLALFP